MISLFVNSSLGERHNPHPSGRPIHISHQTTSIAFWNAEGYNNFLSLDKYMVSKVQDYDIFGILESWKHQELPSGPKFMSNFDLFQTPAHKELGASGRASGGILLFIKKQHRSEILFSSGKFMIVKIYLWMRPVLVCLAYLSPELSLDEALDDMLETINILSQRNEDCPFVIMGDLNARLDQLNQVDTSITAGTNLTNWRTSMDSKSDLRGRTLNEEMSCLGYTLINGRTQSDSPGSFTFIHERGSSTVDTVWANREALELIQDSQVIPHGTLSPHLIYKIVLTRHITQEDLLVSDENTAGIKLQEKYTWPHSPSSLSSYANCICDAWDSLNGITGSPDLMDTRIESSIKTAASRAGLCKTFNPLSTPNVNLKPWMDSECIKQKKMIRSLFSIAKNSEFQTNKKRDYLHAKKNLALLSRKKEKEYRLQELVALSNVKNSKQFWGVMKKYSPRSSSVCPIDVKSWESFYESNYTLQHQEIEWPRSRSPHHYLDKEISHDEVSSCVKALKNMKAPGPNGLSNEFYKFLPPPGITALKTLFNEVLQTGSVPESWGYVKTIVLHKKDDKLDHNNYRNISLFNNIAKIYTQILLSRFQSWAESNGLLPGFQNGFRSERCCSDNLFCLQSAIQVSLRHSGRYLFAIFVDFRQAFDTVQHSKLWERLTDLGLESKALDSIIDLYSKLKMFYVVNGISSKNMKINKGIPQGETLSPLFFILFMSNLETFLREEGVTGAGLGGSLEILLLAFADDIVILGDTAQDIQRKLNALQKYCKINGLSVNTKKTKIVLFHRSPRIFKMPRFKYGDATIDVVKSYTYLGIDFASSGKFNTAAKERLSKTNQAIGATRSKIQRANPSSSRAMDKLYQSIVEAVMLYGSEFWAEGFYGEIDGAQASYYKKLFGWPWSTPHYIVRLETNCQRSSVMVLKKKLNWVCRILRLPDSRLTKKCFVRLNDLCIKNPEKNKENWVRSLKAELSALGYHDLLDSLDPTVIEAKIEEIIGVANKANREKDLWRAGLSRYCPIYKHLRSDTNYMHFNITWGKLRLISQARVASTKRVMFFWKGKIIKLDPESSCPICQWDCPDDLHHLLSECPASDTLRQHFSGLGTSVHELLRVHSSRKADTLFIFISKILDLRLRCT